MCVVGSGSRRWSRGSSRIRIRAMPPPSESHYLLTGVNSRPTLALPVSFIVAPYSLRQCGPDPTPTTGNGLISPAPDLVERNQSAPFGRPRIIAIYILHVVETRLCRRHARYIALTIPSFAIILLAEGRRPRPDRVEVGVKPRCLVNFFDKTL